MTTSESVTTNYDASFTPVDFAIPSLSSSAQMPDASLQVRKGALFIGSVFPISVGLFDFRPYIATLRKDQIMDSLRDVLSQFELNIENGKGKIKRGFKVLEVEEPRCALLSRILFSCELERER